MRRRAVQFPDDLWRRALAITRARNETLSGVLRRALERYVKRHEKDGE